MTFTNDTEVSVFPLNTVLFPGGPLPLRIFEPRYLDMVSDCLRNGKDFAVCCIKSGNEVGAAAEIHDTGTLAHIVDWNQYEDGLLGITAIGNTKVSVLSHHVRSDQLVVGRVRELPAEPSVDLPEDFERLGDLLRSLIERTSPLYDQVPTDYADASWVSYRLAEILPIPANQKQYLLELSDPISRLEHVDTALKVFAESE